MQIVAAEQIKIISIGLYFHVEVSLTKPFCQTKYIPNAKNNDVLIAKPLKNIEIPYITTKKIPSPKVNLLLSLFSILLNIL